MRVEFGPTVVKYHINRHIDTLTHPTVKSSQRVKQSSERCTATTSHPRCRETTFWAQRTDEDERGRTTPPCQINTTYPYLVLNQREEAGISRLGNDHVRRTGDTTDPN